MAAKHDHRGWDRRPAPFPHEEHRPGSQVTTSSARSVSSSVAPGWPFGPCSKGPHSGGIMRSVRAGRVNPGPPAWPAGQLQEEP
jgi:hypothetical protein